MPTKTKTMSSDVLFSQRPLGGFSFAPGVGGEGRACWHRPSAFHADADGLTGWRQGRNVVRPCCTEPRCAALATPQAGGNELLPGML